LTLLTEYNSGFRIGEREMGGDCGVYGEDNGIEKCLVGKPARKRRLEKSRRRWVI
jgi:hypothetical protein